MKRKLKKLFVSVLTAVGKIGFIPFKLKYSIFKLDKRFIEILPAGHEFIVENYLEDLKVRINTVYPIERIILSGEYDNLTTIVLNKFIDKNSVVMDIGANIGALTLQMAKIAKSGKIIAIEPGPPIFARLAFNISLNPEFKKTVTVLQKGVSDKVGDLFWLEDENNRGNAGLLDNTGVRVEVLTLDDIVSQQQLNQLDFIKIDVEGMEYEVIKGGLASINKLRPVIYYETLESFREFRGFDTYGKIYDMLASIDYEHYCCQENGSLLRVDNLKTLSATDMLAIPKEKVNARVLSAVDSPKAVA